MHYVEARAVARALHGNKDVRKKVNFTNLHHNNGRGVYFFARNRAHALMVRANGFS